MTYDETVAENQSADRQGMLRTHLLVEIFHAKPIKDVTDVVANRIYDLPQILGKGCGNVAVAIIAPEVAKNIALNYLDPYKGVPQ